MTLHATMGSVSVPDNEAFSTFAKLDRVPGYVIGVCGYATLRVYHSDKSWLYENTGKKNYSFLSSLSDFSVSFLGSRSSPFFSSVSGFGVDSLSSFESS